MNVNEQRGGGEKRYLQSHLWSLFLNVAGYTHETIIIWSILMIELVGHYGNYTCTRNITVRIVRYLIYNSIQSS